MNLRILRKTAVLLLVTAILCTFCSCQQTGKSSKAAKEDLSEETEDLPELKIGVAKLKAFFYKDENGNYEGIDAEIAREACKRAGYQPDFVEIPWNEKDEYLENGTVDCLWNAFSEDGRENKYLWTDSYMESKLVVMVDERSPDQELKEMSSVGGIAVRAGSKAEEILLRDVNNTITKTDKIYSCGTFEMAETAFVKGYAGALAGHEAVLKQLMKEYPGIYRIFDDTLMNVHLGVAFDKNGNKKYWEDINNAIKDMKQDGTIDSIVEECDQEMPDTEEETDEQN